VAIVGKAIRDKSATGDKIRAGATLYKKAQSKDPKARKAIAIMVAKAKKGDPQAKRDILAVKAGKKAVKAAQKAKKKEARVLAAKARKSKVIAVQRKLEARVAEQARSHRTQTRSRQVGQDRTESGGRQSEGQSVREKASRLGQEGRQESASPSACHATRKVRAHFRPQPSRTSQSRASPKGLHQGSQGQSQGSATDSSHQGCRHCRQPATPSAPWHVLESRLPWPPL